MRSRADRRAIEVAARLAAFAALAWGAWLVSGPGRGRAPVASANGGDLAAALPAWTAVPPAETLAVRLLAVPSPSHRAWLSALTRAGTPVTWSGGALVPLALEVSPMPDPVGGLHVAVAAPRGAGVTVADSLGALDSARASAGGVTFGLPSTAGGITVAVAGQRARVEAPDTALPRDVALFGAAGWESRFVMAALEERGWAVHAELAVAPGVRVTQGAPVPLDTARMAVAVVLDPPEPDRARDVANFVARGGGLLLGPRAATGALASAAPGGTGERLRAGVHALAEGVPSRALGRFALEPRAGAVALESDDGAVVLARRSGPGRVVQVAYEESWRWRMSGAAEGADGHRAWWAAAVAAAAYRPLARPSPSLVDDPAPVAALHAALGPPTASGPSAAESPSRRRFLPLAAALLLGALLLEWASRRLRGAA